MFSVSCFTVTLRVRVQIQLSSGIDIVGEATSKRLPVVIFSHGLGGTPDIYQSIIMDLASRGYIVVAVEHTDHSQSVTVLPTGKHRYYR